MSKIFSLSEASSIAIHSMVLLARARNGINVGKIAEFTGFSKNHIAKVLQRLVKSDLLRSVRGPSGGFYLKKEPKEYNLLEVYEAIEGTIEEKDCPLAYETCNFEQCIIGTVVVKMTADFKDFLKGQTLDKYL